MKRLFFLLLTIVVFSCNSNTEQDKFYSTYRQILIARAEIDDSLEANSKVLTIIKNNGYTPQEFYETYFRLARQEKDFIRIIDSLRNSVKKEYQRIIDSTKVEDKRIEE